jgi:dynein heavy chain
MTLFMSQGDILENEELIATLDNTKTKAIDINRKLDEAQFTNNEIQKARSVYVPAAKRGSIMFFCMSAMSIISKMYTISLMLFLGVFKRALQVTENAYFLDTLSDSSI